MTAVEAAAGDLIVLIDAAGLQVVIIDVPVVSWIVDDTGVAPALPVIPWTLTTPWARIEIGTKHLTPGLIGAATISAAMGDESFRGGFPEFLDLLQTTTGKPVTGAQLLNGNLISAFWMWVSDRLMRAGWVGLRSWART